MSTTSIIHPDSFLAYVYQQQALVTATGKELIRQVPVLRSGTQDGQKTFTQAIIISIDNGNDAIKGAMLRARTPLLQTKRFVTAYSPARTIRAGEGVKTWQVNNGEPFWMDVDAVFTHHAESLPIGFTEERLPDQRYQHVLFACLVELLMAAGYATRTGEFQGEYDVFLSLGIPNEELDLNGPKERVRQALLAIFNRPFAVHRTDEQGQVTTWTIRLVEIAPYGQSFASFATWYYTIHGVPIETDITRHVTVDLGGGQVHECHVDLLHQTAGRPKLRMSASLVGEGTIAIARAARETLRARYPGVQLSDAEAQQMLISGFVTVEGRRTRVEDIVAETITARSQNLFAQLLHILQDQQSFLMFTGGGSILLAQSLRQLVTTKRSPSSFLFVPADIASTLNAIGGYVLAQALAQRKLERLTTTDSPIKGTR